MDPPGRYPYLLDQILLIASLIGEIDDIPGRGEVMR